ncbi:hypothetical protein KEM48_000664 [Puccinia striiformis f. sp. tritici PST-130]|nr:hypothetical protein KEM48_000664 [Puccinia striiformis f. sp. tritici PST-130]
MRRPATQLNQDYPHYRLLKFHPGAEPSTSQVQRSFVDTELGINPSHTSRTEAASRTGLRNRAMMLIHKAPTSSMSWSSTTSVDTPTNKYDSLDLNGYQIYPKHLSNEPASPTAHDLQSSTIVKASSLKDLIPRGPASVGSSDVSDPSGPKSPAVTVPAQTIHPAARTSFAVITSLPNLDGDEHLETPQQDAHHHRRPPIFGGRPYTPRQTGGHRMARGNPSDESDPVSAHRTARLKCSAEATSPAIEETPELSVGHHHPTAEPTNQLHPRAWRLRPWKISNQRSPSPEYPSLQSPTRPQPSYPTTRLVCSFSSATTQTAKQPQPSTFKADGKEPKRSEADRREETLKATLPAFKLEDPAFSSHTVTLCPSAQHPISELPQLIKLLCNDGISLPSAGQNWKVASYAGIDRSDFERQRLAIPGIMPDSLVDFLVNPQIVKIGVGIRNDGLKLLRDHKLGQKPFLNSFLELSRLVRALGQPDCASGYSRLISLQQIVADYLEVYLPNISNRLSPPSTFCTPYPASRAFSWRTIPNLAQLSAPPLKRRCPVVPISKDKGQYTSPDLSSATLKPKEHVEPCTSEARASSLPQLAVPHKLKDNSLPELKKGPVHTKRKQGLAVSQCSKALSLSPVTFATRIGKMLIHLKLNKLTLDDYYYNRIKTLIANPQAFAELASSCQSQVDVADTVACCDDKRQEPSHGNDELGEGVDQSSSAPDKTAQSSSDKIVVSMPVSSSDHKGPKNSPTVQKPVSSSSDDLEPTPPGLPTEKSTSCSTDQAAENPSVIVKTSPLISDDEAVSNFHEDTTRTESRGTELV